MFKTRPSLNQALFTTLLLFTATTGCAQAAEDVQVAQSVEEAQQAGANLPNPTPPPAVFAMEGVKPGKYGCTASRYNAASGSYEFSPKGSVLLASDGTYQYLGFETPSEGNFQVDPAGKVLLSGGYLDGGEMTPMGEGYEDRFYLVAPELPENRWTCGLDED